MHVSLVKLKVGWGNVLLGTLGWMDCSWLMRIWKGGTFTLALGEIIY